MTLHDRFVRALQARGSTKVEAYQGRYTKMTRPVRPGTFYFVGSAGALRFGPSASKSIPVSESAKAELLMDFDRAEDATREMALQAVVRGLIKA